MYRAGSTRLRMEYMHPLAPNQTLVEVLDASDPDAPIQFQYQAEGARRGIGHMSPADARRLFNLTIDAPLAAPVGPFFYYKEVNVTQQDLVSEALSSPMTYLGNTTIGGEQVRIWSIHVNNGTLHMYWYDTVEGHFPRRIAIPGFGDLDVLRLGELPTDEAALDHLFSPPIPGFTVVHGIEGGVPVNPSLAGGVAPVALPPRIYTGPSRPYEETFASRVPASQRRRLADESSTDAHFEAWMANVTAHYRAERKLQLGSNVMCASNNICPARVNLLCGNSCGPSDWANNAAIIPAGPFSAIVGPLNRPPCLYQVAVSVPVKLMPIPGAQFFELEGAFQVQLCDRMDGFSVAQGSMTLFFDPLATANLQEPAASLNPFKIRLIGLAVGIYSSGGTGFLAPTGVAFNTGVQSLTQDGSHELLKNLQGVDSKLRWDYARDALLCFNQKRGAVQVGVTGYGPDLPLLLVGAYLSTYIMGLAPVIGVLSPFLAFMKMTQQVSFFQTPAACGLLQRVDAAAQVAIEVNMVFFQDSYTLLNPRFSTISTSGLVPGQGQIPGIVGTYFDLGWSGPDLVAALYGRLHEIWYKLTRDNK